MPATYEPIATNTLGTATSSVTFSSIPATYTDLKLIVMWRGTHSGSSNNLMGQFNGDTGSNYSYTDISGSGSAATSFRGSSQTKMNFGYVSSTESTIFGMAIIDVFSYAGSTNKTTLCSYSYDRNGSGYVQRNVQLWRSTSAITSISILTNVSNFAVDSTFTLYGIKAA
jgi:hypothetical protein